MKPLTHPNCLELHLLDQTWDVGRCARMTAYISVFHGNSCLDAKKLLVEIGYQLSPFFSENQVIHPLSTEGLWERDFEALPTCSRWVLLQSRYLMSQTDVI